MAVQQLQAALSARQPVVEILSPQDDAVLPAGPWSLKLRVHDWPLVDGGTLGVGPHLVVQVDQEAPRIWTSTEGLMSELSPGSHRLTVYAALPWGEARKNPGAAAQIRLHRTAPNPVTLPAAGSPQLLAVSPSGPAVEQPLLLDWLLLDAPLQDVGGSGTQWRLRVSINDEDVLIDEQSALWLRGWRPGPNALRLELLDARGEALNPPFNSLVQEVDLNPTIPRPRWRGERLSAAELAILLGEASATAPAGQPSMPDSPATGDEATPADMSAKGTSQPTSAEPSDLSSPRLGNLEPPQTLQPPPPAREPAEGSAPPPQPAPPAGRRDNVLMRSTLQTPEPQTLTADQPAAMAIPAPVEGTPPGTGAGQDPPPTAPDKELETMQAGSVESSPDAPTMSTAPRTASSSPAAEAASLTIAQSGEETLAEDAHAPVADAARTAPRSEPTPQTMPPNTTAGFQDPAPPPATAGGVGGEERIQPTSTLSGKARDLVNEDGTLRRPDRRGPLASLRERLQR